jgi:hypothetical protein
MSEGTAQHICAPKASAIEDSGLRDGFDNFLTVVCSCACGDVVWMTIAQRFADDLKVGDEVTFRHIFRAQSIERR